MVRVPNTNCLQYYFILASCWCVLRGCWRCALRGVLLVPLLPGALGKPVYPAAPRSLLVAFARLLAGCLGGRARAGRRAVVVVGDCFLLAAGWAVRLLWLLCGPPPYSSSLGGGGGGMLLSYHDHFVLLLFCSCRLINLCCLSSLPALLLLVNAVSNHTVSN